MGMLFLFALLGRALRAEDHEGAGGRFNVAPAFGAGKDLRGPLARKLDDRG